MTFAKDCATSLRSAAERLLKLLELDAPDVILAREIVGLWDAAEGAFGAELHQTRLEVNLRGIKHRRAYCNEPGCDNTISPTLSHYPICEQCDARIEEWLDANKPCEE